VWSVPWGNDPLKDRFAARVDVHPTSRLVAPRQNAVGALARRPESYGGIPRAMAPTPEVGVPRLRPTVEIRAPFWERCLQERWHQSRSYRP
jgi:hypothetical protein